MRVELEALMVGSWQTMPNVLQVEVLKVVETLPSKGR